MKYQKEDINLKSEKVPWKILICFMNHVKLLLNYLMLILQLYLRPNTKQFIGNGSKY